MTDLLATSGYERPHLEIGTAAGGTLKELMSVYPSRLTHPEFHVLDPMTYFPNQMEIIRRALHDWNLDPDSVIFHVGITQTELPKLKAQGTEFDFIFIDGVHRAYPVMIDLQWADLLAEGGVICLHDNQPKFPGVGWSINRFLKVHSGFKRISQVQSLTILKKTGPVMAPAVRPSDLTAAKMVELPIRLRRSIQKRLGKKMVLTNST
ncbi:MAG: class I SAM-dependent methyltransferase [Rhodobacteraceae bacterium]|nr:class I SAM-dependent methyltransferase [Paracoccaceae bacterium]